MDIIDGMDFASSFGAEILPAIKSEVFTVVKSKRKTRNRKSCRENPENVSDSSSHLPILRGRHGEIIESDLPEEFAVSIHEIHASILRTR